MDLAIVFNSIYSLFHASEMQQCFWVHGSGIDLSKVNKTPTKPRDYSWIPDLPDPKDLWKDDEKSKSSSPDSSSLDLSALDHWIPTLPNFKNFPKDEVKSKSSSPDTDSKDLWKVEAKSKISSPESSSLDSSFPDASSLSKYAKYI